MGRKVYITSDISIDERLGEVSYNDPLAALMWPWILTSLDDWGRFEANPRKIKLKVFPGNDLITVESIDKALSLYAEVGMIYLYEVKGKQYFTTPPSKWFKYQTHIKKYKAVDDKSKYPAPPSDITCEQVRAMDISSDQPLETASEIVPSPSPSPSPSLSPSLSFINNNNTRAREENETLEPVDEPVIDPAPKIDVPQNQPDHTAVSTGTVALNWIEQNWGRLIPKGEADKILAACDELLARGSPEPDGVVIEAAKQCLDANARNMNYMAAVLKDWREQGVVKVAQIEAREAERKSQKGRKVNMDPGDKARGPTDPAKYDNFYL